MKRFELTIKCDDVKSKYTDMLIVALAHYGYTPYIVYENKHNVCIEINSNDIIQLGDN